MVSTNTFTTDFITTGEQEARVFEATQSSTNSIEGVGDYCDDFGANRPLDQE
jgi:hypothetical protein